MLPPRDPAQPVNNSVNNTGLRELPPAQPAFIAYSYELSEKYPELGSGAHSAVGGPIYHRTDFKPDAKRPFPRYYEGKWLVAEFERGWIMSVTMDADSRYVSMEPFLPTLSAASAHRHHVRARRRSLRPRLRQRLVRARAPTARS